MLIKTHLKVYLTTKGGGEKKGDGMIEIPFPVREGDRILLPFSQTDGSALPGGKSKYFLKCVFATTCWNPDQNIMECILTISDSGFFNSKGADQFVTDFKAIPDWS